MPEQDLTRLQCVLYRMSLQVSKQDPDKVKKHSWLFYVAWEKFCCIVFSHSVVPDSL